MAPWEVSPEFIRYTLENYILTNTFLKPTISFYPAAEYGKLNDASSQAVANLRSVLDKRPTSLGGTLPYLPSVNAGQVFAAKAKYIDFKNGNGLRYLTEYAQYAAVMIEKAAYDFNPRSHAGSDAMRSIGCKSQTRLKVKSILFTG